MDAKSKNQLFLIVLGLTLIVFAYMLFLSQQDQWFWADVGQHQHPPAVNISRHGDVVYITWLGGWDAVFVDHLKIEGDAIIPVTFKPSAVGHRKGLEMPLNSTVTVYAYDKAVHHYTLLNSATL